MASSDGTVGDSQTLQLCLALQDRLESVEKEFRTLKDENIALRLALEEMKAVQNKTYASVVSSENGEASSDSASVLKCDKASSNNQWVVASSKGTLKCVIRKQQANLPLTNKFDSLSDNCEDQAECKEVKIDQPSLRRQPTTTTTTPRTTQNSTTTPKSPAKVKNNISVVGDSLVRHLDKSTNVKLRKVTCLPGAGVKRVQTKIDKVMEESGDNPIIWLNVGSNDIEHCKSEELLDRYTEILDRVRRKGGRPVVHGILPRRGVTWDWSSRAIGINSRLEQFCQDEEIPFLDNWCTFYGNDRLYARDGVHLSRLGVQKLASTLEGISLGFC